MTLGRALGMSIAGLMVVVGALFTFQGLGYVGGSSMTGETTWAVIGPILAGLGVGLAVSIVQRARQQAQASELERNRYGGKR